MVMETPSPQCVGREFVRQYYTLLHEAPLHLHRFYSHNSSFVHGGVEKPGEEQPPVMGQGDIHKKIMSLNFRDCHAKIRQVDSQATVGNAVVVQVTGELSNNGQPMRRFMQTFVLAPQSPKKYYVHNDIFRYQDEVFHDTDTDTENQEDAVDSEAEGVESQVNPSDMLSDAQTPQFFDPPPQMSNGSAMLEEDRTESPVSRKSEEEEVEEEVEEPEEEEEEPVPVEMETYEPQKEEPKMETVEIEQEEPTVEPKPFSWAALASKNTQNTTPSASVPMSVPTPVPAVKPPSAPQRFGPRPESKQETSPTAPQPQRAPRPPRDRDRERISVSRETEGEGDPMGARRPIRYPDSQQLFVGNLPHNISEKELKTFFEQYGHVIELRINTKSSGGKLPNFGFVIFESPDPVQHILSVKPIKFNGEHRLNVEEKKAREGRMSSGRGPPPRSGSAGGGGFSRGGSAGRGSIRPSGPPGMRGEGRGGGSGGGMSRGGMAGPRR